MNEVPHLYTLWYHEKHKVRPAEKQAGPPMWAPSVRGNKPAHSCGPLFFSHQIDLCSVAHRPPKKMSDLKMRQENNPLRRWVIDIMLGFAFQNFLPNSLPWLTRPCVGCACASEPVKRENIEDGIMGPTSSSVQSCAGTTYAELAEGEGMWIPIFENSPSHVICDGWKPFFHYSNEMTSSSLSLSLSPQMFLIFLKQMDLGAKENQNMDFFSMSPCFMIVVLQ